MQRPGRNSRRRVALVLGSGLALVFAGPAWGQPRLEGGDRVRANSEAELTLWVPVERADNVNQKVVVELPGGFAGETCVAEAGWTCAVFSSEEGDVSRVMWERLAPPSEHDHGAAHSTSPGALTANHGSGGGLGPGGGGMRRGSGEVFHFGVRTPAERGSYPLVVEQVSTTGQVERWDGPADSPNPAPKVTVM